MPSLLVGIPCYNEQEHIASVVKSIPKEIAGISHISCVVIDDGSSDDTRFIAASCGVEVIRNEVNLGLGRVYEQLVELAQTRNVDFLVTIDGDGQFDGREMSNLVVKLERENFDVCLGSRFMNRSSIESVPFIRRVGNSFFAILIGWLTQTNFQMFLAVSVAITKARFLNCTFLVNSLILMNQ